MREREGESAYVNSYELDTKGLVIIRLGLDAQWLSYITANRRGQADMFPDADVIIGPIANDTIFDTMGIFTSGFLSEEESIHLLSVGPSYTQIVIKSKRALEHLKWTGARTIPNEDLASFAQILKDEEDEYQNEIGRAVEQM